MNMKKTIAAIAAGAVAVSAMATTVSAAEAKTLNYNLTATLQKQSNGKVTLKATFPNVTLTAGDEIVVNAPGMAWTDKIVVSGNYIDTNKAIDPITFTRDIWSEGYSAQTEAMLSWDGAHIPVRATNNGSPALIGSAATTGEDEVLEALTNGVITLVANDATTHVVNPADFRGLETGTYSMVATSATAWDIKNATGFIVKSNAQVVTDGTVAAGDTVIDIAYTAPKAAVAGSEGTKANITVTVNLTTNDSSWEDINKKVQNHTYGITLDGVFGNATTSGKTDATAYKMPFMTNVPSAVTGADNVDIINYLQTANVVGDDKHYVNVRAVLNDAIENYDGVTFTFNTAATTVRFATVKGARTNPSIGDTFDTYDKAKKKIAEEKLKIEKNLADKNMWYDGDIYVVGLYADNSWDGTDMYKEFGEHTYDWYYSPETTGYTGYDWGGSNLFAGALIVNEHLTMSLSNTEYFDWTKTSVSFDWDSIMDNAATTNNYATYIQTIKLATSSIWFWDSMDVVLTTGDADDVSADAGVTADDDTLDDDDDDIGVDDDEPADDDDDDDEPAPVVDEPAPAPVVSNPPTGNAPVALAVIPVALAAAAIVAKKRG